MTDAIDSLSNRHLRTFWTHREARISLQYSMSSKCSSSGEWRFIIGLGLVRTAASIPLSLPICSFEWCSVHSPIPVYQQEHRPMHHLLLIWREYEVRIEEPSVRGLQCAKRFFSDSLRSTISCWMSGTTTRQCTRSVLLDLQNGGFFYPTSS